MAKKENNLSFIDDLYDEIDDPIVDNFNTLGYLEQLIYGSLFTVADKDQLMDSLLTIRESEVSNLIFKLKSNANYIDPKDQLQMMFKNGVFN